MTEILVNQMPAFKKIYKKLPASQQQIVDQAIDAIIKNPKIGQEKKGNLAGIFVYKFLINRQETLLTYEWDPTQRILLLLGTHENFYRSLKNKL